LGSNCAVNEILDSKTEPTEPQPNGSPSWLASWPSQLPRRYRSWMLYWQALLMEELAKRMTMIRWNHWIF
jgi:hypothetical protein